ncbi:MAG: uracil phosphoribosyltransferase [Flavobacteriales bacterium]|nr:uracil phosphoribosyltransferase [Flavobacteriales bacterium]
MEVHVLNKVQSIFNQYVAELRDVEIQKDSLRFRRNLERIGEILGYEISKTLNYKRKSVITPLGTAKEILLDDEIVLGTILRAGLPMHNGLLDYFDKAENAFISAYRKHEDDGSFQIRVEYFASPSLENKVLILSDPMLASGKSMVLSYEAMLKNGTPKHTYIAAAIASKEGVEYAKEHLPENTTMWIGAVDDELSSKSYIIPGLGDAGDLAFGGNYSLL